MSIPVSDPPQRPDCSALIRNSFKCFICNSSWTSDGGHRVVSLKCGHLFGRACIRESLENRKKCPICQSAVRKTDLRPIKLDTKERQRLRERLYHREAEIRKQKDLLTKTETELEKAKGKITANEAELQLQGLTIDALRKNQTESKEAHETAIAGKDAEIQRLKSQLSDVQQGLQDMRNECHRLEQLLENGGKVTVDVILVQSDGLTETNKVQVQIIKSLMEDVADKVEIPVTGLELRFKGRRIREEETGYQIGLKDDDVVHAYVRLQSDIQ